MGNQPEILLDRVADSYHDRVILGSVGMLSLLLAVPISTVLVLLLLGNVALPQWALMLPHLEWSTGTLLLDALAYMLLFGAAALVIARVCSCTRTDNNISSLMYTTLHFGVRLLFRATRSFLCGLIGKAAQTAGALAPKASLGGICLYGGRETHSHHIRLRETGRARDKEAGHVAGLLSYTAV